MVFYTSKLAGKTRCYLIFLAKYQIQMIFNLK